MKIDWIKQPMEIGFADDILQGTQQGTSLVIKKNEELLSNKRKSRAARIKMEIYAILDTHDLNICFCDTYTAMQCNLVTQLKEQIRKLQEVIY